MNNVSTVNTQHCISNHFSLAEPRIGARRQATQEHHAMDTLKKRGGNRRSGENSPPAQTQQSVMLQK